MSWPIATLPLRAEEDVVRVRSFARHLAQALGFNGQAQVRIATAVSEIARNAVGHGGGGFANFALDAGTAPPLLAVRISDDGPGVPDIEGVLDGRVRSPGGLGLGVSGARRLMDSFAMANTGRGLAVDLGKRLGVRASPVPEAGLPELARRAAAAVDAELGQAGRHDGRELLDALESLDRREREILELRTELQETNRGVVALHAELEDAAEQVRRTSEAKARFLSSLTHEFRTPLNSVLALAGLLLARVDGPLSPEQERQVLLMESSARTLSQVVDDLLDLAKADSGKLDVRLGSFRVAELFGTLRGVLGPLRPSDAVELVFEPAESLPPLVSDENKVAQILRNLVSNALKFTERGSVRVSARLSRQGEAVAFAVRDTGIGIAPEHRETIFEEFAQIQGALQARTKGTGLGLPLARRLALLLGGDVAVESAPGEGSTFTLTLPSGGAGDSRAKERGRILVADGDPAFRALAASMLAPDFAVAEAADGFEALRRALAGEADAVLLALDLPGLDGAAVLEALRGGRAELPVVICHGAPVDAATRGRLDGATMLLRKADVSRETLRTTFLAFRPV